MGRKLKDVHLLNVGQGRRKLTWACKQPVESSLLPCHLSLICRLWALSFHPSERVKYVMREKLIIFQTTMCEIQQIFKALTSVTSAWKIFWCVYRHKFWAKLKFGKEFDDANSQKFRWFKQCLTLLIFRNGLHICCC